MAFRLFLIVTFVFLHSFEAGFAQFQGEVINSQTREPVSFAYVHLHEVNRVATADKDGLFTFQNIPEGAYTISIHRIGYLTHNSEIIVSNGVTARIQFLLQPESVVGEEITVTGEHEIMTGSRLQHASSKIIGEELRRNLGTTISETLGNQPGFSERSLGPAPGRPVIRGLGGERVLILQDGERTGDVSSQSADHAVSIDPMGAEEIEIARGPAALAYGANAIGGIINVVKNQIPSSIPSRVNGVVSLAGKSVNREGSASVDLSVPADNWVVTLDLNGKTGRDFQSPEGAVQNTYLRNSHNTIGLSRIGSNGYLGGSASYYISQYGIPPDPNGGHPNGVDIEMSKLQFDFRAERLIRNSFFNLAELRYSFVNYEHTEFESSGVIGTKFGNLNTNASLKFHNKSWAIFDGGNIGLSAHIQDYAVMGARTPDSNQYSFAAYIIQEGDAGPLHYEFGSRFEYVLAKPKEERVSPRIGLIESKDFAALANSFSLIYELANSLYLGTTLMHSFRAPSLEELYSEGPHLAAYSFEIGNPRLDPERGLGLELFLRYETSRFNSELTAYRNRFFNYNYARDTGEQSVSNPGLNNYQFVGEHALFYGLEFSSRIRLTSSLTAGGTFSHTLAERDVGEEERAVTGYPEQTRPLPMIPPLHAFLFVRQRIGSVTINLTYSAHAGQTRLGEFETPTDGYQLLGAAVQYRIETGNMLHTFSLNGTNLLNTTYRSHLSRIKEIFPAPGRNFNFLYRLYF